MERIPYLKISQLLQNLLTDITADVIQQFEVQQPFLWGIVQEKKNHKYHSSIRTSTGCKTVILTETPNIEVL